MKPSIKRILRVYSLSFYSLVITELVASDNTYVRLPKKSHENASSDNRHHEPQPAISSRDSSPKGCTNNRREMNRIISPIRIIIPEESDIAETEELEHQTTSNTAPSRRARVDGDDECDRVSLQERPRRPATAQLRRNRRRTSESHESDGNDDDDDDEYVSSL